MFYVTFLLVWWLRAGCSRLTLPGPWGFPVLGHLPMLGARSFVTMNNYRKWYGDVYKLRMGQRDVVVVNGPTAIRTALVKKSADFAGRPDMSFRHLLQGHSVAFAPYSANWHLHRRIVHRGITATINDKKAPTDALISEEAMSLGTVYYCVSEQYTIVSRYSILLCLGTVYYCVSVQYTIVSRNSILLCLGTVYYCVSVQYTIVSRYSILLCFGTIHYLDSEQFAIVSRYSSKLYISTFHYCV